METSKKSLFDKKQNGTKERSKDYKQKSSFWIRIEWKKARLMLTCTMFCFVNMAFQEQTLRLAPKSSNFISFLQHIFITVCGLLTLGLPFDFGSYKTQVPIKFYLPMVFLNFFAILTNNLSHNYGVSIPLNMIFKSSSLVANMLLGMLILHHRYSLNKFISVIFITLGLILCTIEDYRVKHSLKYGEILSSFLNPVTNANTLMSIKENNMTNDSGTLQTTIGISLLTVSLLLSASIGIYQEYLAKNFVKNSNETLYYVHLLSLPIFLLSSLTDIQQHFHLFAGSIYAGQQKYSAGGDDQLLSMLLSPTVMATSVSNHNHRQLLWLYLLLTILTQYLCIRSVYRLTTECSSLSVTLCVTNRKFLSLLFSIFYFENTFTIWHWSGSLIVFGGTICFYLLDTVFQQQNRSILLPSSERSIQNQPSRPSRIKVD